MTPDERPAADEAVQTVLWMGTVNAPDGLNLRPTPATAQPPLALLSHQTALQVLEDLDDWLRVIVGEQADGARGYVYAAHVLRLLDPNPFHPDPNSRRTSEDEIAAPADRQIMLGPNASGTERLLASVWNRYGSVLLEHARRLQIDPALAAALLAAESNGNGFSNDGRLLIRFENHIFYHYWGKQHQAQYFAHFTFDADASWRDHRWRPDPTAPWQACHLDDQSIEWQVFSFARQLDETAALLSISMGLAQVMGFNYAAVGFSSVQAMFQAYSSGIVNQIAGVFRFLETNNLVQAARAGEYHTVARGYNGPGDVDAYASKLHRYVATLAALQQPVAPAVPAPAIPAPVPVPPAPADVWRGWLNGALAAIALLLLAAMALYQMGWRLVRKGERNNNQSSRKRAKVQQRRQQSKGRLFATQIARLIVMGLERLP